ncbi:MAG: hypothetical protein Q4F67_05735 [Propionibacteriaceae bacterium]|nr:hypothetical protein [Propionibacteriaceae bacterium]
MARHPKRREAVIEPVGDVRRFEMPFTAAPGRLVNPEIGLRSISLRSGEFAPYTMDVTVLDAPDLRLVRAGVWLAHRVVDGRGEWYLATDRWTPWLPAERVEQMGDVDLPDVFADLVRPFRRGAALGPVAALTCEREEFALRGPSAELVAVFRDDQVQVRSGGVVTASYREVTLTGVAGRLTGAQLAWLTEVLCGVGATRVEEFPPLAQRLGAPATGLSDVPEPRECRPGDSLDRVWAFRLGRRMRELTYGDLALRAETPGAHDDLAATLRDIRAQLRGFVPLIDRSWARGLTDEIDWVLDALVATDRLDRVLNGERYLRLLDRLMSATRAPALGGHSDKAAGTALSEHFGQRLSEFLTAADALTPESADEAWQAARTAAVALGDSARVQIRPGEGIQRIERRAGKLARRLGECVRGSEEYAGLDFDRLTTKEAFAEGRRMERVFAGQHEARVGFLQRLPRYRRELARTERPAGKRPRRTRKGRKTRQGAR